MVSSTTVSRSLHELGYSLQSVRKSREGTSHPVRNAQFEHINTKADELLQRRQPVVSVETKKKELVGEAKNGGRLAFFATIVSTALGVDVALYNALAAHRSGAITPSRG